ncbi:MAG: hypothetical protein HQ581_27765 [Planctomycetes bacterium]|nr:hypothetical protein [Planctomycetota bacterium]
MNRVRIWLVMGVAVALGVSLVSDAQAQRRGMRGSFLGLLSVDAVQKELKLSDEHLGKVKEMTEKFRTEAREKFGALGEIEDRQARYAKMRELSEGFDENARKALHEMLPREQMMRLYQIRLQVRGNLFAVNNGWMANRMKLTDEQKKKAADLETATREKTSAVFSGIRELPEQERRQKFTEAREKIAKVRAAADEQAVGILNAEQKEMLEKAKGEKFEMP